MKWIEPIYEEKKKNVIVHPLSSVPGVFRRFCIFSVKEKRILHFKKGKKFNLVTTYIKCIFSSNQIVQKIWFSLCFWASDLLIDKLY